MVEINDGPSLRAALLEIAGDFSFTWTPGARALFAELAPERFAELGHNPKALLSELTNGDLERALTPEYAIQLGRVQARLAAERERVTWWEERPRPKDFLVAYFSAEFGLDQSLPVYSGGLGILAGDHLKAASELGVPLVGIGLYYRRGYFRQRLDQGVRQVERYPRNDTSRLPLTLVPMAPVVELATDDGELVPVRIGVWLAKVGRVRLFLLDTKVEGNPDWARAVTDTLYGGDRQNRLRQELVLGVGGVRVLRRLGLEPSVFHMNEGHSAFLQLERLRELVEEGGVDPEDAIERLRASSVFTTHTPVPAGNEVFDEELVRRNVGGLVERCGLSWERFRELGKAQPDDPAFGMTPFALHTSAYANGVSALHGAVSREMWQPLWPDAAVDEVPITSITNGVHVRTWISDELEDLLGHTNPKLESALDLSDQVLWDAHQGAKQRMLDFVSTTRGVGGLEADILTIGFARRFATYKRASLLFSQPERLAKLLDDPRRPIQILIAGKAHPADEGGKDVIQRVIEFARTPEAADRVRFLEDYEMTLARRLVQGVDVWLNTPRRPMEASGTSGMKAALNGVLNCSILDGWWAEGYSPDVGFAIGDEATEGLSEEEQDAADAEALFAVLEEQVIPAYYDRKGLAAPARWVAMMRQSIARLGTEYSTTRMVAEYTDRLYLPAHETAPREPSPVG
ncbi:MAG: alpha-glucan family phosphorylase [Actinobacteria bacterium]|nr:alpha-glucan family phosphorylase [Actinomycetota bacterium]